MALLSDIIGDQTGSFTTYRTGRLDLGSRSGTVDLNLALSNDFTCTLTGTTTFNIINTPSSGVVSFSLQLTGGGSHTTTFTNAKYPAATAPALTSGGIDVITFITYDNGTNWRGTLMMKDSR